MRKNHKGNSLINFTIGIFVGFAVLGVFLGSFFYFYDPKTIPMICEQKYIDAIHLAQQLGRLDLVSLIITMFAIILGLFGLAWLSNLRNEARLIAIQEAKEVADKVARETIATYSNYSNHGSSSRNTEPAISIDQIDITNAKRENNDD